MKNEIEIKNKILENEKNIQQLASVEVLDFIRNNEFDIFELENICDSKIIIELYNKNIVLLNQLLEISESEFLDFALTVDFIYSL